MGDFYMLAKILRRLANIDLRSLALFRIGLGITVLVDLHSYVSDFALIFSDEGIHPRAYAFAQAPWNAFSLFFISGEPEYAAMLFIFTAFAALALIFGYKTRLACLTCWLMIASLNTRALPFLYNADAQTQLLLFWSIFLPLGARFSVDHALSQPRLTYNNYATVATLALLLQESYLYFFGALFKTSAYWQTDYTAIEYALNMLEVKHQPFSDWLLQYPDLLRYLTMYVYNLEFLAIFFLFFPIWTAQIRFVTCLLLIGLHMGFFIFLDVGYFPLVSITGLLVFIPAFFWDKIAIRLNKRFQPAAHILYYDEPCDFCRKTCLIFRELSILYTAQVEPAQNTPEIYAIMQRENSWVVKTPQGALLTKWDAVAYMWRHSPLLFLPGIIFSIPFMRPAGNFLYTLIAKNRGRIATYSARFLPYRTMNIAPSLITSIALLPLIASVLALNIYLTQNREMEELPTPVQKIILYGRLYQTWHMFAIPSDISYWITVAGKLDNGDTVDLLFHRNSPPALTTPTSADTAFPSDRINSYILATEEGALRARYGYAICQYWKRKGHPHELQSVTVRTFWRQNLIGTPSESWPVETKEIFTYNCQTQSEEPKADETPPPDKPAD
jgi:predicted DCC family thiol-disulfide oxidoreductase YuxK